MYISFICRIIHAPSIHPPLAFGGGPDDIPGVEVGRCISVDELGGIPGNDKYLGVAPDGDTDFGVAPGGPDDERGPCRRRWYCAGGGNWQPLLSALGIALTGDSTGTC